MNDWDVDILYDDVKFSNNQSKSFDPNRYQAIKRIIYIDHRSVKVALYMWELNSIWEVFIFIKHMKLSSVT